ATAQYFIQPGSDVPTVGASGAIAAVLGAYAVTYPRARVVTLLPLFPFFPIVRLSALVVLGLWFVFQFFSGALSLAWSARGGVATVGPLVAGAGVSRAAGHSARLLILPVWLLLRMALNALDGMMARERHMASSLGMVLNELGDVVSDLALYLPLAWVFAPA